MKPVTGRLTVISSVKNAADTLERTIASVAGQRYGNLEYLIVDGGSTDGTAAIVAKHDGKVGRFLSEPDQGVYFGMNRGVSLATGEWITFLNAGDTYCGPDVLSQVMDRATTETDVLYGDHYFGDEPEPRRALPFEALREQLRRGAIDESWIIGFPCHQAVFARSALLREMPYDTGYRHAAEQEFLLRAYDAGRRFEKCDVPVCRYEAGGMSHHRQIGMLLEKRAILKKYHGGLAVDRFFAGRILGVLKRRLKEGLLGR